MARKILLLATVLMTMIGCSVLRPPLGPHRSNTPEHVEAKSVEDCLGCHGPENMPHPTDRGNCLKCHRLEMGE